MNKSTPVDFPEIGKLYKTQHSPSPIKNTLDHENRMRGGGMSASSVEGQCVVLRWGQYFGFLECGQNPGLKR